MGIKTQNATSFCETVVIEWVNLTVKPGQGLNTALIPSAHKHILGTESWLSAFLTPGHAPQPGSSSSRRQHWGRVEPQPPGVHRKHPTDPPKPFQKAQVSDGL